MRKLILLLAAPFFFSSCIFRGCTEEKGAEAVSPDGAVSAAVHERNCGATTSFVAHVNLRPSDRQFSPDSDGVIKDGQVFVVKARATGIRLVWDGPKKLIIECSNCGLNPQIKKEDHWRDIAIDFRNTQPDLSK
jgi:hypothetical protein